MSNVESIPKRITPSKWKKYKILSNWGLRDDKELEESIHRYRIEDYPKCLDTISCDIKYSKDDSVYVIKLIYPDSVYKLPNFLISNIDDLVKCKNKLKGTPINHFSEIWYCKNSFQKDSIYGRVLYSLQDLCSGNMSYKMELVWGKTARMIELYPNMTDAFATVEVNGRTLDFYVTNIIYADKSKSEIYLSIERIIVLLRNYYKRIYAFGNYLMKCGCSYLCVEFSYKDEENLLIIDWDSDDDMKVIKPNNSLRR